MTEIRNVGQEVQAEIRKTARRGQEAVAGAIRTWTGTVRAITPPLKELRLPSAGRLPMPEELAVRAYVFAHKLLASQRRIAEDMLHAAAPMLPRIGTAQKAGPAGKPGPAEEAHVPSKAAATHEAGPAHPAGAREAGPAHPAETHKVGPEHKPGTARKPGAHKPGTARSAAARKAGPAGQNGSAGR